MNGSVRNYWVNLLKLLRGDRLLRPVIVAYYVTLRCNLDCAYCEDSGRRRNGQTEDPLPLEDALRVLSVIRSATDSLILTGGEPLLYPDIVALVKHARHDLGFRNITLLTNGLLLRQHEAILPSLNRLVISLDSTDPQLWGKIIDASPDVARLILDTVCNYARRQRQHGIQIAVNCVLTPETLASAHSVLEFCIERDLLVSFSPQAVHHWPRYDLLVSDTYKGFLTRLMQLKRRGALILGSMAYLRTLRDMVPYACFPTLVPRVMPNGDLVYPCRPIEKEKGEHGGRPCNLLNVASWDEALETAIAEFNPPPRICTSCFQQCFAEPSLMQARPMSLMQELLRYAPSRRGGLWTHAPG